MQNKKRSAVITGMGVICAVGRTRAEFLDALQQGRRGIREITLFDCTGYPSHLAAQIDGYDPLDFFDLRELRRLSRVDQFVLIAAEEALADAALVQNPRDGAHIAGSCADS